MPCERWGKMNSSGIDAATTGAAKLTLIEMALREFDADGDGVWSSEERTACPWSHAKSFRHLRLAGNITDIAAEVDTSGVLAESCTEDCQFTGCNVEKSPLSGILRIAGTDKPSRAGHCRAAAAQGKCREWPTFMTAFECCKTCQLALLIDRESYLERIRRQTNGIRRSWERGPTAWPLVCPRSPAPEAWVAPTHP